MALTRAKRKPRTDKGRPHKKFGLQVKEAEHDMAIKLLQVDIDNAAKHKPDNVNDKENFLSCVIAEAATRSVGADSVAIMHRWAYVAFPGESCTRRYAVSEKSRRVLEAWDRGEHVVADIELLLKKPSHAHTLAEMRKRRRPKKDYRSGTGRKQKKGGVIDRTIRNGNLVRWS